MIFQNLNEDVIQLIQKCLTQDDLLLWSSTCHVFRSQNSVSSRISLFGCSTPSLQTWFQIPNYGQAKILLKLGLVTDISHYPYLTLLLLFSSTAAAEGRIDILNYLLTNHKPSINLQEWMMVAARQGQLATMQWLYPHLTTIKSWVLYEALKHHQTEAVALLLQWRADIPYYLPFNFEWADFQAVFFTRQLYRRFWIARLPSEERSPSDLDLKALCFLPQPLFLQQRLCSCSEEEIYSVLFTFIQHKWIMAIFDMLSALKKVKRRVSDTTLQKLQRWGHQRCRSVSLNNILQDFYEI